MLIPRGAWEMAERIDAGVLDELLGGASGPRICLAAGA
jgi:hypothetical protein